MFDAQPWCQPGRGVGSIKTKKELAALWNGFLESGLLLSLSAFVYFWLDVSVVIDGVRKCLLLRDARY